MEPTPSPYSMKINVSETLKDGVFIEYKQGDSLEDAPDYIRRLFEIEGIKGIFRVVDFITIERNPRINWEEILPKVAELFDADEKTTDLFTKAVGPIDGDAYAGVKVFIQIIRNIPTQIKLVEGETEKRIALPERIMEAAMEAAKEANHYLLERKWVEQSPRYGEVNEIGQEVVEELSASYDTDRLQQLVELILTNDPHKKQIAQKRTTVTIDMFDQPNWKDRYAALDRLDPTLEDLPILNKALDDEKASIRRLATAYLGMIEEPEVLPYLYKALKDKAVNVRRTAGDCLSDLGYTDAIPEMIQALDDSNRLVRWRAAMFLYEVGDETAIPALRKALDDPEFEVRMQVKMALARIEEGEEAKGSIWKQMTEAAKKK